MVESRISTFAAHQNTISDLNRLQTDLTKLQRQISSGKKAANFSELGADIRPVLGLESSLRKTDQFIRGNEIVINRLSTMDIAVSQMEEIASEFAQLLATENSPAKNSQDLTNFAEGFLDNISEKLNTQLTGRFLFAGGKTNLPAVGDLKSQSNIVQDVPTANYYQGDDLKFEVKANEQLSLEYGITANDEAFRNLIGSMHKAIEAEQTGNQDDLDEAINLINQASEDLIRVRSQINSDKVTLQSINEQHERVKVELNSSLADFTETDVVEASIKVSLNEVALQASFQTFARISSLNLVDFLR